MAKMHVYVVVPATQEVFKFTQHDKAARMVRVKDGILVRSEEELSNESISGLVSLWNTIVPEDQHVEKFRDKPTGVKRVWGKIAELAQSVHEHVATGGPAGRPSRYTGKKIFRNVAENPRKPNTHGAVAWDLITDGMTYEDYMTRCDEQQVGGRGLKHLNWCVHRNLITISD